MTQQPSSTGSAELLERMETFADHGCSPNDMQTAQELVADALLEIRRLSGAAQCAREWRCFHCDETFTDEAAAKDHFGYDLLAEPGCKLNEIEGGLLGIVRRQEEQLSAYHREDTAAYREFYSLGADHRAALITEEEKGYGRGLRDAKTMPSPKRHPVTYEDGTAPWSEDEQFDTQQSACDRRCQQYGSDHCEEKDGSCSECEYDAQVALRAKYAPPASTVTSASSQCAPGIAQWIAYADKLERALEIVAGSSSDELKRTQAEDGLRLVRPSAVTSAECCTHGVKAGNTCVDCMGAACR